MIKGNNKFRINHASSKPVLATKSQPLSFTSFFNKAIQAVKEKAANAYSKFENKLGDTPAVFSVGKDERLKELSVQIIQRDRDSSISKNSEILKGRTKSNLTNQDSEKLRHLMNRKQQLMQKLRKIDYQLLNPPHTLDLGLSRASAQSPLKQLQSRIKVQQSRVYNPNQHQKTIQMLSRINNEKIKRQERIVQDMKRKQQQQIKKLNDIEYNKSQLTLNRRKNPIPLIKFNTKETENLAFDRKTNSVNESNHKIPQKLQNEFDQLPEVITSQKPYIQQKPIQQQNI